MITPIYAGIIALMLIGLSANVIRGRRLHSAGLGDADKIDMKRRIRAQANLVEYAPLFLILSGFAEHGGLPPWGIHILCVIFLLGRIMHAYSLLRDERYEGDKLLNSPVWRIRSMILTFTTVGIQAIIVLIQGFVS